MNRVVVMILVSLLMLGCSTTKVMEGTYTSEVDPDFSFTVDKSIAVLVANENALVTKHYVKRVVDGLKKRGFLNVDTYKNLIETDTPIDIIVMIAVSKTSNTYQYQSADYGMVDSGRTTTNCTGYGYSINCTSKNHKTFGVTGYSTKTGYTEIRTFSANWFKQPSDQKIMFTFASSFNEECSDRAVYEFLIDQTLETLDFEKPMGIKYSHVMPETYTCAY